jgi:hypothetical protein
MDDWGSNIALLIDPELWRTLFKPLYRQYCEIIHDAGKYVFMHSDGFISEIIEDLVEIGVDALNAQLFCMDLEQLAERFRGRITFWGEIDRQRVLPFSKPEDVGAAVRRLRNAFKDDSGGMIAQCTWGTDVPLENVMKVYETWM